MNDNERDNWQPRFGKPEPMTRRETCYAQFTRDMESAGFEVDPYYYGRGGYVGPAVRCERHEEEAVIAATELPLCRDAMGLGSILYPG